MTEHSDRERTGRSGPEHDVWSRPSGESDHVVVVPPSAGRSGPLPGSTPIVRPGHPAHHDAETGLITASHDLGAPQPPDAGRGWLRRRAPIALGAPAAPGTELPGGAGGPRPPRLGLFLGIAGGLLGLGLVVVLVLALTGSFGGGGLGDKLPFGGKDKQTGPPLAQACPPPTATANPGYREGPPPPPGPRTTDTKAGISYQRFGAPWQDWHDDWYAGQLKVHYVTGQSFVTERYSGGEYLASVLSGSVPATVNDGNILDLKCVGQQIVADVRKSYYPQPNQMDSIESKLTTVGGLHAWVSIFRLHFDDSTQGLKAKSELVGVATFDVGKPTAAVLYVSIPGTHQQYDSVVSDAIDSVRAAN
jgi:hypothetical protein